MEFGKVYADFHKLHTASEKTQDKFSQIIYENSPQGIFIWDSNLKIVSANRRLLELYCAKDLKDLNDNIHKVYNEYQSNGHHSISTYNEYLKRAIDGETMRFEWENKTLTGEPLPIEVTFVRCEHGQDVYVAAYITDLRDVKAAEEHTSILIAAMPTPSALLNASCEVIDLNHAAVRMFAKESAQPFEYKRSADKLIYRCNNECSSCAWHRKKQCIMRKCLIANWKHTVSGYFQNPAKTEEFIKHQCRAAIEKGILVMTSHRYTLSGKELFIETTIVPVKYKGEQGFAIYMRDLSDARLREIAEEESRAKTRFLAQMSHEIRTPMNAVLGIAEIQLQDKSHPPATEDAFLRIYHSSQLLLAIINDILDLSKVEAGKMEIVTQPYETSYMIAETIQLNMMNIGEKPVDFQITVDPQLPRVTEGDEIRIKQIMNNLLSNAFKYTKKAHVALGISRGAHDDPKLYNLLIEIKDTGQGMTKSQLNTLFQIEFNRLNPHINREIEGSGLGMAITYNLVTLMGGKIIVDSSPGIGTTFLVRIPQRAIGKEVLGKMVKGLEDINQVKKSLKKIKKISHKTLSGYKILVVDDVESNLFVAKGMLRPYRLIVETAHDGKEALEKIRNGKIYDIIFMDHMMPVMDGLEATKLIREEKYTFPIIALTANTLKGEEDLFLRNGFTEFIPKPLNASTLDNILKKYLKAKDVELKPAPPKATLTLFLRDAKKIATTLTAIAKAQDWEEKDLETYRINIHEIKHSLKTIGENYLSDIAATLEEACKKKDIMTLEFETMDFLDELAGIVETFVGE